MWLAVSNVRRHDAHRVGRISSTLRPTARTVHASRRLPTSDQVNTEESTVTILRCRAPRTPILLLVGVAAAAVPVGQVATASTGPAPTGGHSEVIAQSLVEFGDGEFSWQFAT